MPSEWKVRRLQFLTLYRVFFLRVVDLDLLSADADLTRLMGQFASIFCTFSFVLSVPLLLMNGTTLMTSSAWGMEHFFIETSMTVAGLIAILNWDAAFPDKRDLLILRPLPVKNGTLFLAKLAALAAGPALAVIALNIFTGFLWPLLFRAQGSGFVGVLRALPAYWTTLCAASSFFVLTALAVQGLAVNLLPRQIFLRLSAVFQATAMCVLLSVYFLEPSLSSPEALTDPRNQHLLSLLPSYWFLGLFNQLNGSMHPGLASLAARAWTGLACSTVGAGAALLLCYFRLMGKIVEQPDILPQTRSVWPAPRLGAPLTEALTLFSMRTLLRSRQHRMIFSFYLGIGITIIIGYVHTTSAGIGSSSTAVSGWFLFASTLMMTLTVLALRVVASIPIALQANWIMRVTQIRSALDYQKGVRISWLTLGVTPVVLVMAMWLLLKYPWRPALGHLSVMLLLGILLVELCLYTFPKIPFTCSYSPGKAQIHIYFWVSLLFGIRLLSEAAAFESRQLYSLARCLTMLVAFATAAVVTRYLSETRASSSEELRFEEEYSAPVTTLGLS
jgi:hypothetical protein